MLVAGLLLAVAGRAENAKFDLKPVAVVRQHLYAGAFAAPRGLHFDRVHDELWVADTGNNLIAIFGSDAFPLHSFPPGTREPIRMAVDPAGRLLVIHGDRTGILLFNYRGEPLGALTLPGLPEKPSLGALAFDGAGNLYVGDNNTGQVLVYDPGFKLRRRFGGRGADEGEFQSIGAIAVDGSGAVYVLDHQVLAVQVFDSRGNFLRGWGRHDMGAENVSLPSGVALDSRGHVIVVDSLRHEIKFFDTEGKFLARFGGYGNGLGQVAFPADVAVDGRDRVYVIERGNARIQIFEQVPSD